MENIKTFRAAQIKKINISKEKIHKIKVIVILSSFWLSVFLNMLILNQENIITGLKQAAFTLIVMAVSGWFIRKEFSYIEK